MVGRFFEGAGFDGDITLPITITRDGKDSPANEGTALWRKPRAEVTEQSAQEYVS